MAKTDTQVSLRVTSQFKARLERQAERERRSVSNLILKVMEEYLERQEETENSGICASVHFIFTNKTGTARDLRGVRGSLAVLLSPPLPRLLPKSLSPSCCTRDLPETP